MTPLLRKKPPSSEEILVALDSVAEDLRKTIQQAKDYFAATEANKAKAEEEKENGGAAESS